MKYLKKKFSTPPPSDAFRDNWDSVFGETVTDPEPKEKPPEPEAPRACDPLTCEYCNAEDWGP